MVFCIEEKPPDSNYNLQRDIVLYLLYPKMKEDELKRAIYTELLFFSQNKKKKLNSLWSAQEGNKK